MSKDISEVILEELREFRRDMQVRVNKVESWQANADGKITMFGLFCTGIGGIAAWLASHIGKGP